MQQDITRICSGPTLTLLQTPAADPQHFRAPDACQPAAKGSERQKWVQVMTDNCCAIPHPLAFALAVVGALLGTQVGRDIQVMNTFELVVDNKSGSLALDHAYFVTRADQCQSRRARQATISARLVGGTEDLPSADSQHALQSSKCFLHSISWVGTRLEKHRHRKT